MEFLDRIWAEIDIDNLIYNFNLIKKSNPDKKIMAVIKADAYGHGDYQIAKEYINLGVDYFAVSNVDEAVSLRNKGIETPILIFGATLPEYFNLLVENDLTQTVFCREYAKKLSDFALEKNVKISVHVKIDTGMGRMGFIHTKTKKATDKIFDMVSNYKGLIYDGIYTHFSHADSFEKSAEEYTNLQYYNFEDIITKLEEKNVFFKTIHCQNSGAIMKGEFNKSNTIRPGIILYGLPPSDAFQTIPFKPIMSLKSTVSSVKCLEKGSFISYSRKFVAKRDMCVAIIPVGYADGYFRSCYKEGFVLIRGKKAKIIGVICMDQFMVDVTEFDEIKRGDEVILMGESESGEKITANDIASWAGTINYEVICAVARRVPRIYEENDKMVNSVRYL